MLIDPAINLTIATSLALLLAAAAAHKLAGFRSFAATLGDYRLLPAPLATAFSAVMIIVEMAIACGLLIPALRATAAVSAAALFITYGAAIAVNIARGRVDIDCGCSFGRSADRLSFALIWRNALLAAAALVAAAPASARALGAFDLAASALFVVAAAAFYLTIEALRANAVQFDAMGHTR